MTSEIKIPVKLFVSKFPQTMTEDALREIFSEFGEIESVVILKSKDPSRHQGCGFIRFTSVSDASRAIHELNAKYVVDSEIGPITVEYAAGEAERLNLPASAEGTSVKLFVGGVPLSMTDEELVEYFSEFGTVTECHALPPKTSNPLITTKAAFVRFSRKSEALAAIEACDKKRAFPDVDRPMDVRIAESKAVGGPEPPSQYRQPAMQQSTGYGYGHSRGQAIPPARTSVAPVAPAQMYRPSMPAHPYMQPTVAAPPAMPRSSGGWTEYLTPEGKPYYHNALTNVTTWEMPPEFRQMAPPQTHESKGPMGSNLFVFHIPIEWGENDLFAQFSRFGNIVSHRIVRERDTNRPKGFGFVSFDNPNSARAAIAGMNGMMVSNGKRLKVSIKKGEEFGPSGGSDYAGSARSFPTYPY